MRILVHDFAGHPFQAQLSRALAGRGDDVVHAYCGGVTTGRGDLARRPDDPPGLRFVDVSDAPFERYAPIGRIRSERYGRRLVEVARDVGPEVVLSANTPLLAQAMLWRTARRRSARRVYWVQDFLGRGVRGVLHDRSRVLGHTAGRAFERLETALLRRSDALVVIADDFVDELARRRVRAPATVVENWAPLDELVRSPQDNPWSRSLGVAGRPTAVYAGTLGLKHDPRHLVDLAEAMRGTDEVVVVVTEGRGRDALEAERTARGLEHHLVLQDFVDYDRMPDVLGTADVALVLLEADAGTFSVPSKVLSYLAAGCAVVGAMPARNLAARVVRRAGAGSVVDPGDHAAFAAAVRRLLDDEPTRRACAASAHAYAHEAFAVGPIADAVADTLTPRPPSPTPPTPSPGPSRPAASAPRRRPTNPAGAPIP